MRGYPVTAEATRYRVSISVNPDIQKLSLAMVDACLYAMLCLKENYLRNGLQRPQESSSTRLPCLQEQYQRSDMATARLSSASGSALSMWKSTVENERKSLVCAGCWLLPAAHRRKTLVYGAAFCNFSCTVICRHRSDCLGFLLF